MVKLYVGPTEYDLGNIKEGELAQLISKYKKDGVCPCVKVVIKQDGLNLALQTAGCSRSGGGRAPNPKESYLCDLWASKGLNDPDFSPGNLISFLKQALNHLS